MKIVEISFDDVMEDAKACSALLDKACHRQQPYKVVGCVSNDHAVFVTLAPGQSEYKYRFALFPSFSSQDITGEISSRYAAGFITIGSFSIDQNLWGLFAS
jgi:hypothetical protein